MYKQILFSVDDTFGCFSWLNKNYKSVKNIFDSSTFGFARDIYEKYGIGTSFYCMYTDGINTLDDIVSRWSEQFRRCKDWMKFGFHCYDGESNYSTASIVKIEEDYTRVINALVRITGCRKCLTDTLRLHYFAGNDITVDYLKKNGIKRLLCADDARGSYNLSKEAEKQLKVTGFYCDENTGMEYIPTNVRLENTKNLKEEIRRLNSLDQSNLVIFTHERYLKEVEIRSKLDIILKEFTKSVNRG